MNIKDVVTLIALALIAACDPAAKVAANSNECTSSALVGVYDNGDIEVTGTASCKITLKAFDGSCTMTGTFGDIPTGEGQGEALVTVTQATVGCEMQTPDSFTIEYMVEGDKISFVTR